MKLGYYFSVKNKNIACLQDQKLQKQENNWLVDYAKMKNKVQKRDFFIFGHQHYPCDVKIDKTSRYINLGDWIDHYTYAEFDGSILKLKHWNI